MSTSWGRSTDTGRDVAVRRFTLLGVIAATALTVALLVTQFSTGSGDPEAVPAAGPDTAGAPLSVPAAAKVLFIGDDWTAGEGAALQRASFVHLVSKDLGWEYRVDAVPGSGWAHSAPTTPGSQYLDRVFRLQTDDDFVPDVVVISAQMRSPATTPVIRKLMRNTVTTLRGRVPDAVIAVVLPYGNPRGMGMCEPLENDHITCVDTFGEEWLTGADAPAYFGEGGLLNNDGHAYFAERLAADLERDLVVG
ncbi:hypothetical protein NPS01_32400 [Nocardioides psychrotolerans]|uniref:GDSL-like Lipase/Acylhydrolase family protein n=1 Tax=Nocardioides psychrotolerans TaxID=1005945 RepID=A0A1I3NYU8_9ACTN|nr:hypothetical protein [Nocardioides psychrotolerans]GEP39577.1 hypothetical protein NPS01_32400 [Nocardioides psychrotolerans]SFJ14488.1 hypothetical protein SAMN05216561_11934 [Nocardioides psychrotolerans]